MTARTTRRPTTRTATGERPGWWSATDRTWHWAPAESGCQASDGLWMLTPAPSPTPPLGTPTVPDVRQPEHPLQLGQPTATAALARPPASQRGGAAHVTTATGFLGVYLATPRIRVAVVATGASLVLTVALALGYRLSP